jgi:hypothetical protein
MNKTSLAVGVMMMWALAGCSSSGTTGKSNAAATGADGGAGSSGAPGAAPGSSAAPALACGAIVDCIDACGDTDQACADACVAKGSPDGQAKVTSLAQCIDEAGCKDVDCVTSSCSPEVTACLGASGGGGAPIPSGGAPATGSIPADLQGEWMTGSLLYNFKPDGTVDRVNSVNTAGCQSSSIESGVAVANGDALSIYFTTGKFKICGSPSTDPYHAKQEDFTWSFESSSAGPVLVLAAHTCQYDDPSSIGLYCTDKLDKQ